MKKVILILVLFLPIQALAQNFVSVTDGDTLHVEGDVIRIFGIDAPELKQVCNKEDGKKWNCGEFAKSELIKILNLKEDFGMVSNLDCTTINKDRYGRSVSLCFVNNINIGREMVRRGAAVAYKQYSLSYELDEDEARAELRGIWQGEFMKPWDWRAKN